MEGSAQLVRTLAEHHLVDESRLMIYPIVLGSGKRLLPDGFEAAPLRFVESKPPGAVLPARLAPVPRT